MKEINEFRDLPSAEYATIAIEIPLNVRPHVHLLRERARATREPPPIPPEAQIMLRKGTPHSLESKPSQLWLRNQDIEPVIKIRTQRASVELEAPLPFTASESILDSLTKPLEELAPSPPRGELKEGKATAISHFPHLSNTDKSPIALGPSYDLDEPVDKLLHDLECFLEYQTSLYQALIFMVGYLGEEGTEEKFRYIECTIDMEELEHKCCSDNSRKAKDWLVGLMTKTLNQKMTNKLRNIWKVGEVEKDQGNTRGINMYARLIKDAEGLDKIEDLQTHENADIYDLVVKILEKYLVDDKDQNQTMDDATQPNLSFGTDHQNVPTGGFNFG
eukprot:Gb_05705 [translate_table: standard]